MTLLPELSLVLDLFSPRCTGIATAHQIKNPGPIIGRDMKPKRLPLAPRSVMDGQNRNEPIPIS